MTFPVQPLPRGVFPLSSRKSSFMTVSIPYVIQTEWGQVVIANKEMIQDICKYPSFDSELQAIEHLFLWKQLAPTAPDTLCNFIIV